jgi:hypothetical protein
VAEVVCHWETNWRIWCNLETRKGRRSSTRATYRKNLKTSVNGRSKTWGNQTLFSVQCFPDEIVPWEVLKGATVNVEAVVVFSWQGGMVTEPLLLHQLCTQSFLLVLWKGTVKGKLADYNSKPPGYTVIQYIHTWDRCDGWKQTDTVVGFVAKTSNIKTAMLVAEYQIPWGLVVLVI